MLGNNKDLIMLPVTYFNMIDFDKELEKFAEQRYKGSDIAKVKKYFVLSKGKRIRPNICFEIARHYGKDERRVLPLAIAVELIHSASLAFDDLPIIDDAIQRRGKESVHKKYSTMIAVFAGSSAVLDGIRLVTEEPGYSPSLKNRLVQLMIDNISDKGLIGSQEIEMGFGIKGLRKMLSLYEMKASSLFKICCVGSAMICLEDDIQKYGKDSAEGKILIKEIMRWKEFARHLGIMFQIRDDFLDYSKEDIGKDKQKGKWTIIKTVGKPAAFSYSISEKNRCKKILREMDVKSEYLDKLLK